MKRCPECRRDYYDDSLMYCLEDGTALIQGSVPSPDESQTAILPRGPGEAPTRIRSEGDIDAINRGGRVAMLRNNRLLAGSVGLIIVAVIAVAGYRYYYSRSAADEQIASIAVMPFVNESGNTDLEYLSDGMTESLINNLSQLPGISVKPRSSVFRYKGREDGPQKIASDLSVQAILTGRVVQHGSDLTLYLSLVNGRRGDQIWGEQYNRKLADLVALQTEIVRDVSNKLRVKLSRADEEKLAKNYTANPEAYQLYLKGRYHVIKITRPEIQTGISYFQQAIAADPSYPLAYVGLADGYRALVVGGEMDPGEYLPKAKAAAQKAVEIDDRLADAHAELGFIIFWYDWDWNAAESQCKRALELDPNNSDAHLFYAHLLSNTGRHPEALAEAKRALELDPLNLRTNALGAQFVLHAGRTDEALEKLGKTLELDSNYSLGHVFASSAYSEKGMFDAAITEGQKAIDTTGRSSQSLMVTGYALAKAGRQAEARKLLDELLERSTREYVRPYNVALIYHGLNENAEALKWLERGYELRDPMMTFIKVDPKLNDLRSDKRFQELVKKVGLPD